MEMGIMTKHPLSSYGTVSLIIYENINPLLIEKGSLITKWESRRNIKVCLVVLSVDPQEFKMPYAY